MADDEKKPPAPFDLYDPGVPTFYANTTHALIGSSDVSLLFGFQPVEYTGVAMSPVRIVLTHDSFMKMMEYWAQRYETINKIYGDSPRSINGFDRAKVEDAFQILMPDIPDDANEETYNEETYDE